MNVYTPNQKVLPAIAARELYAMLAARHDQPGMFLSGTGLFAEDLHNDQHLIAPSQWYRLVRQAMQLGTDDLPCQLGHRLLYSGHSLAHLLQCCPRLATGLCHYRHFQGLWALPVIVRLSGTATHWHLDFHCPLGRADLARFFLLCTASLMEEWLRLRFNANARWQLPASAAQAVAPSQHVVQAPLWRLQVLKRDLCEAWDAESDAQNQANGCYLQCQQQLDRLPAQQNLLMAAIRFLRPRPQATLLQLASWLRISPATLKRRLKEEGTSFQQLQDGLHGFQAMGLLADHGWTNQQLAHFFHINDVNNFRRAFRRWTGVNPSAVKPA